MKPTATRQIVFDTSVFIDHLRTNCHSERMESLHGLIRNSAVVIAELLRGAARKGERDFVASLARNHPILTPSERNWIESGEILSRIYDAKGFDPKKLRDLHFDLLIALSARSHGATLITSNRQDFELIREYREFRLEVW